MRRLRLQPWLQVTLVVLAALALVSPSIWMGFYSDDYVHQLVLDGDLEHETLRPANLYDFGSASDWQAEARDTGGPPWWIAADWKTRFFRPLSSLSIRVDHALFGKWAMGYHLTSLAWYALALVLAHATWRALGFTRREALLALALFGATCGAGLVAGWPANRNTLIASAATLAAVLVVVRGRGRPLALVAGLLFAAAACLAKESGVLAFALIAVWSWTGARGAHHGARATRVAAIGGVAAAVSFVVWLWAAGYGANSAFYASPWGDPLRYASQVGVLLSAGVLRLFAPVTVDLTVFAPDFAQIQVAIAGALVLPLTIWVARRLRGVPATGFLALWLVLALAAQGGAPPSDRLLFDAACASAGLLALFFMRTLPRAAQRSTRERRFAWAVALAALPLSAMASVLHSLTQTEIVTGLRRSVLAADVGPPSLGRRELVVLQASSGMLPFVLSPTWAVESGDRNLYFSPVQFGRRGLECERVDERTLELRTTDEPFLTGLFERVYLSDPTLPGVGARFDAGLFEVLILESSERGPTKLRLTFDRSLDDPTLRLLADRDGELVSIQAPRIGQRLVLEQAQPPIPLMP